jgi:hypothetical protein
LDPSDLPSRSIAFGANSIVVSRSALCLHEPVSNDLLEDKTNIPFAIPALNIVCTMN